MLFLVNYSAKTMIAYNLMTDITLDKVKWKNRIHVADPSSWNEVYM